MYQSLVNLKVDFHLYVFAFDDFVQQYFQQNPKEKLTVISLEEFEDKELLEVKRSRSSTEYCWTCTPSTILYSINKFNLDSCTYVDADLYFYSDPKILIDEMGDMSVLITSHRYTPEYDQSEISGKYCVQFMTFKNTKEGMQVLNWWREACLDWCFAKPENGKFGDQKYLDDWPTRFQKAVHELEHLGGGLAPWNIQQYSFDMKAGKLKGVKISSEKVFTPIFFHFHRFKMFKNDVFFFADYKLSKEVVKFFYKPYAKEFKKAQKSVKGKLGIPELAKSPELPRGLRYVLNTYWNNLKIALKYLSGKMLYNSYINHNYYKV